MKTWMGEIERVGGGWAGLGRGLKWNGEQEGRIGGVMRSRSSSAGLVLSVIIIILDDNTYIFGYLSL